MDGHRGISAIIGLHPDVRSFLADDGNMKCLKKSNKFFSVYDREHDAPRTISTSRNPTKVL
jgi:hypothetical protein